MKKKKCPVCGSTDVVAINDYQLYITFDETTTVIQYLCISGNHEWDEGR